MPPLCTENAQREGLSPSLCASLSKRAAPFFDRLAAALTRTNGRTPPERRYRPGARSSRTSANTQHDTWYTNIRTRTSQQDENDDGYKKQHTRLPKTGCAAITEMHILFKHGFQISAKGRGQLFDVSAGGIHKKVVVFPRTPFLLTEESVILCAAAVDLRNPFLHLRFCQMLVLRTALHAAFDSALHICISKIRTGFCSRRI